VELISPIVQQSFSLEALGEYALFAIVWLGCRAFGENLRVLHLLDAPACPDSSRRSSRRSYVL
jgi:hypothetical protein